MNMASHYQTIGEHSQYVQVLLNQTSIPKLNYTMPTVSLKISNSIVQFHYLG